MSDSLTKYLIRALVNWAHLECQVQQYLSTGLAASGAFIYLVIILCRRSEAQKEMNSTHAAMMSLAVLSCCWVIGLIPVASGSRCFSPRQRAAERVGVKEWTQRRRVLALPGPGWRQVLRGRPRQEEVRARRVGRQNLVQQHVCCCRPAGLYRSCS